MNASVVGYGTVGKAIAKHFGIKKHFDLKDSNATLEEVAETRYVFICLPTDVRGGRYLLDDIKAIIRQIKEYRRQNVFIIKSTVFPGFAEHLMNSLDINSIVSCPEFLSEDTALKDIKNPDFIVVGGRQKNYIEDVVGIHRAVNKGVDIIKTDNTTAEMIKMSMNSFFATKVVFANQMYDYCQKVKANYETVKETMYKSRMVAKNHLDVFHKGGRGAAGKCLKKDLEAFSEISNLPLLVQVNGINKSYLYQSRKK